MYRGGNLLREQLSLCNQRYGCQESPNSCIPCGRSGRERAKALWAKIPEAYPHALFHTLALTFLIRCQSRDDILSEDRAVGLVGWHAA